MDPNTFKADLLLSEFQQVMRVQPDNVIAVCVIGGKLGLAGRAEEARKCYRKAVEGLQRAARAGDVRRAIDYENMIYDTFVKPVENEEHYYRCFADWKDDLAALGRRFRDPAASGGGERRNIAFFVHSGFLLGHVQVLFEVLKARPPGAAAASRVYVVGRWEADFVERFRAIGIEVVLVLEAMGRDTSTPWDTRLEWLRERFRQDGIETCVWVSVPTMAAFALSMRLAPVQIFWAMRFHPITGPNLEGHITWGAPDETTRRVGKQVWDVVPMPLATDTAAPAADEVAAVRRRFPERVLLGTLAREEKINSEPFLRAVAGILNACPEAGFLWTGRAEHQEIASFLRAAGVASRCHFAGWVDTRLYAAVLDIFLDTFPVGSGVTSLQAFAAGTPLLSYLHPQTIFGTYFWARVAARAGAAGAQPALSAPDEYPILCARDATEYVALASRLISDAPWRRQIAARGHEFFLDELRNNEGYARRFFETVSRIVAAKRGR